MRFRCSVSAWLVFVLSACGTAAAQDTGKVGVTMAFPASLGVIFHATDTVAIRPEFSFARNTTEGSVETNTWTLGTGVSALFYLHNYDHVRTYVSPRYGYSHASASASSSSIADTTVTSWSVTGSFGTEYAPTPKFSVFGEIGVGYTRQSTTPGIGGFNLKGASTAMRAGVGIIFYP